MSRWLCQYSPARCPDYLQRKAADTCGDACGHWQGQASIKHAGRRRDKVEGNKCQRNSQIRMTKIIHGACLTSASALSASRSVLMSVPSRSTNKSTDRWVSEVIIQPGQERVRVIICNSPMSERRVNTHARVLFKTNFYALGRRGKQPQGNRDYQCQEPNGKDRYAELLSS